MFLTLFVFAQQGLNQCFAHVRYVINILINYQSDNLMQKVNCPLLLPNLATPLVTNQSHDSIIPQNGFLSIIFIPLPVSDCSVHWPCHERAPRGRMSAAEASESAVWVVTDGPTRGGAAKDSILEEVMLELQDLRNRTLCRQMMLSLCPSSGTFPFHYQR